LWINDSTRVDWKVWWDTKALESAVLDAQNSNSLEAAALDAKNSNSLEAAALNTQNPNSFGSSGFTINVNEIAPADRVEWNNINEVTNNLLGTIIQSLMVPLWAIALLIMTIWAWYMIFYHWQDELLSKWKSIFNSWLIALVIALGSYYIVSLVRFILYSNNF